MKKIFVLAGLLALVAIMAVPMAASAATTIIGGSVTEATVTMTPPSAIAFGALVYSATVPMEKASTAGSVTVVKGTSGVISWTVTAQATTGTTPGKMSSATADLTTWLLIGKTLATPADYRCADGIGRNIHSTAIPAGVLTYTGTTTPGSIPFCARQWIETTDTTPGVYSATITFTATCLP
jgi:hypothetical protein